MTTRASYARAALLVFAVSVASGCRQQPEGSAEPGSDGNAPPEASAVTHPASVRRGGFRYLADAPRFRDCATGVSVPVAQSGAYIEVEKAYLDSGISPGSEVGVELRGYYLERSAADGPGRETVLVVERFDGLTGIDGCEGSAGLAGSRWTLTTLRGTTVEPEATPQAPTLIFDPAEKRVHGHAGCNRFFGSYELAGDALRFGGLGATRMACPQGMDVEQAYLQALAEIDGARLSDATLELTAGEDVILTFGQSSPD